MITKELLDIIDQIAIGLKEKHKNDYQTELEDVLARLVKLTEEVGELNSEVLKKYFYSVILE